MKLRTKILLYLIVVHVVFFGTTAYLLRAHPIWLLAAEAFFALSLFRGVTFLSAVFEPLRMIQSGIGFLEGSDFATRFREVKQPEMNQLVHVYNRMADHLREERVRSEEQEHFLQSVLSVSPTGVLTLDLDRRVASANAAAQKMFDIELSTLLGHSLEEIDSSFAADLARLNPGEVRLVTLRGRHRVRCRRGGFLDRGFTREFFLLEEFTHEYHHAERTAYGKLIRVMSHEVNNTTGAVNSLLESCLNYRDQLSESDSSDFVRALEVSVERNKQMSKFMNGFADVVRLPVPTKELSDIRILLERIAELYREEFGSRNIDIRLEFSPGNTVIPIDPAQIEQVLLNIVKNALEAIGQDGTIVVRLLPGESIVRLEVEDTGPGIAPEVAEELFTSFFTTKENGQGVGLTLVREILLGHGCDFSLEGPVGGPTRFRVSFPAR